MGYKKLVVLFVLLVTIVMSSCAKSEDIPNKGKESSDKILTLAMPAIAGSSDIKKLIPQFEKETGIKVDWNEFDYNTHYERVLNDMKNGQGTYDVIFMNNIWVPMFAGGGYLTDLEELGYPMNYLNDNFAKPSINLGYWPEKDGQRLPTDDSDEESKLYGIPQQGSVQLLTWRKDILGDEPPGTWDEAMEMIEDHRDDTDFGFVVLGESGNPVLQDYSSIMWSHGLEIVDEKWNPIIDSKENLEVLRKFNELSNTGPPGSSNYNSDELVRTMAQGSALMSLIWSPQINGIEDEENSEVAGKMGYALPPQLNKNDSVPNVNTGHFLLGIPDASAKKDLALEFIKWVSSKETQTEIALNGGVPAVLDAFIDDQVIEQTPWFETIHDGLALMHHHPKTPLFAEIEQSYGGYLNLMLSGEMTPEEAAEKAQYDVYEIMEANGYYE